MEYEVKLPFCTPTRRFAAGLTVTAAYVDGPLTAEMWRDLGYLAAKSAEAAPAKRGKAPATVDETAPA